MPEVNRGNQLAAVCWSFLATAVVSTLLRCYVRSRMVQKFGLDDWFIVGALVSFILFTACVTLDIQHGVGRRQKDIDPDSIEQAMKLWWYSYIMYCLTMMTTKVSIACSLLRVMASTTYTCIIHCAMWATIITSLVFLLVTIFECRPVSYFWNKDQSGSCISIEVIITLTYSYSAFSLICDFIFAFLPITLIWHLQINKRSKIALLPVLSMGCVAGVAVAVRLAFVKNLKSPDFLYSAVDVAIWSTVEQGLAITAGSLATLRPLIRLMGYKMGLSVHGPVILQDSNQPKSSLPRRLQSTIPSLDGRQRQAHFPTSGTQDDDRRRLDTDSQAGNQSDGGEAGTWTATWNQNYNHDKRDGSEEELTAGVQMQSLGRRYGSKDGGIVVEEAPV